MSQTSGEIRLGKLRKRRQGREYGGEAKRPIIIANGPPGVARQTWCSRGNNGANRSSAVNAQKELGVEMGCSSGNSNHRWNGKSARRPLPQFESAFCKANHGPCGTTTCGVISSMILRQALLERRIMDNRREYRDTLIADLQVDFRHACQ